MPTSPDIQELANPWRHAEGSDEQAMWLAWLVRLRWLAIMAQLMTLAFTFRVLSHPRYTVPLLLVAVTVLIVANYRTLEALKSPERLTNQDLLRQLGLDLLILTGFFIASGGSSNPFVMLYVIHVAMASVMLNPKLAARVTGLVVAVNVALHYIALPIHPEVHSLGAQNLMNLGQTIAFTVTVVSVSTFVMGMSSTLRHQKQKLMDVQRRTAQTDRLRALGTLAAGTAHELNTPLSTMDLRLRRIRRRHTDEATRKDLDAIGGQLSRCVDVVQQLLVGAGDPSASGLEREDLRTLVQEALSRWTKGTDQRITTDYAQQALPVELPRAAFTQGFINLLENAREAQEEIGAHEAILVRLAVDQHHGIIELHDHGPGFSDARDRLGEPFFTTKADGTGLGVFVARAVATGAGGGLSYERRNDTTIARWWFPLTEKAP